MNVRIEEQNLRLKISEQELDILLSGHCLHIKVNLPGKALIITINPQGRDQTMESKLIFDDNDAYLSFLISPEKLQDLSDLGRSRAGLQQELDGLSLSLQVDVRADNRKVGKR